MSIIGGERRREGEQQQQYLTNDGERPTMEAIYCHTLYNNNHAF